MSMATLLPLRRISVNFVVTKPSGVRSISVTSWASGRGEVRYGEKQAREWGDKSVSEEDTSYYTGEPYLQNLVDIFIKTSEGTYEFFRGLHQHLCGGRQGGAGGGVRGWKNVNRRPHWQSTYP